MIKKGRISWAFYDFGNSAFSAIVQTFIFATYFTQEVAENEVIGGAQWGYINAAAGLCIALGGPILGAIADQGGKRKGWLAFFTAIALLSTACLWFITPGAIFLSLVLVGLGIIGSEYAFIFYNAMLPDLVEREKIGRWSGWGWGFGYAGGILSLILALQLFDVVDSSNFLNIRATFLLCAVWYLIFSLPLFLWTPDKSPRGKSLSKAVKEGYKQLLSTFTHIRQYKQIVRFLIARMFYIDGLVTLFAFGGVYAATVFNLSAKEVLLFGIVLHVTSGVGAFLFAFVDDWIGSKKLILISLAGLIFSTTVVLLIADFYVFWTMGLFLGVFVGPVQAASRSFMARVIPKEMLNEMFGFFAFSGKATAFLGPLAVGWLIAATGSQRVGLSVILFFFMIGGALMLTVQEERKNLK